MNMEAARKFIYRNARPLDLARWQFLFEDGSREAVLTALAAYQNEDGGFGHGLEPDCLNPNSSPVQTWAATEIIKEVDLCNRSHPIIQGILKYLETTDEFDGHVWANTIESNDDYPHAPWWSYSKPEEPDYNPTASLIGFILKYAEKDSPLYDTAIRLAKEAYAFFEKSFPLDSMHTAACFVELYEYLCECNIKDIINLDEFKKLLQEQISHMLTQDTSVWSTQYVCKPSLFIKSKESVFYSENKELCDFEKNHISETQNEDGTWNITWDWGGYPEQCHVSRNWWKSDWIIKNVKFYEAMEGKKAKNSYSLNINKVWRYGFAGIAVALGGMIFSDLLGNFFNGMDYGSASVLGICMYLCIVVVTCTGVIVSKIDEK